MLSAGIGPSIMILHLPPIREVVQVQDGEDCVKWFVDEMMDFEKDAMAFYYDEKRLQWEARLAYDINYETH